MRRHRLLHHGHEARTVHLRHIEHEDDVCEVEGHQCQRAGANAYTTIRWVLRWCWANERGAFIKCLALIGYEVIHACLVPFIYVHIFEVALPAFLATSKMWT